MKIEWHEDAIKDLKGLDRPIQKWIRAFLDQLRSVDDLRARAEAYRGPLRGYWKLRLGDYRLICEIETETTEASVFIILVAHRSVAYKPRTVGAARKRGLPRSTPELG